MHLQPPFQQRQVPQLAALDAREVRLRVSQQLVDIGALVKPATDAGIRLQNAPHQFQERAAHVLQGGYFWYPLMDAETGPPVERFGRHYFDRDHAEYLEMIAPAWHVADVTRELVERELGMAQADTFLDEVWRFDATILIVDDPVKRVDNMPMAWGLEVRVPFLDHELVELAASMPPELKLKEGGKYPLKAIARGLIPDAVIDRPKGYFPVPALKHVRGPFLELMRAILQSDACIQRGLYQRGYVDKLLANPEAYFTRIQGSKLWHLALLEWWLQMHIDGVPDGTITQPGSGALASTSHA